MNTQEQQTQNIQSQEQKNRNPKYSKICKAYSMSKCCVCGERKVLCVC